MHHCSFGCFLAARKPLLAFWICATTTNLAVYSVFPLPLAYFEKAPATALVRLLYRLGSIKKTGMNGAFAEDGNGFRKAGEVFAAEPYITVELKTNI
jgi:hypothetical protein